MEQKPSGVIDASLFEGLFQKGLTVDSALEAKLATAGYDLRRPVPTYSQAVFQRCIDVTSTHLFPHKSMQEGHRELGRRIVDGFRTTLLGSVMLAVLPRLPPAVVVGRLPRWFKATAPGSEARIEEIGPQERRLVMVTQEGSSTMPGLMCGVLERLVKGWTVIEVVEESRTQTIFRIAWA
jgi:uncharacterized protein (TIGR02265 family)